MSNLYFAFLHKETSGLLKVVYAVPFFTRRRRFTWIKVGMKQSETRRLKRIVSVKAWFMADRNYLIRIGSVNLWSSFYFMYLWYLKYVRTYVGTFGRELPQKMWPNVFLILQDAIFL